MIIKHLQRKLAQANHKRHQQRECSVQNSAMKFKEVKLNKQSNVSGMNLLYQTKYFHSNFRKLMLKQKYQRAVIRKPIKNQQKKQQLPSPSQKSQNKNEDPLPPEIAKQLEDILPDSRWVKWIKMYLLINKYYTDIGKLIIFFLLGFGVFSFYSIYFLARNPSKLLDIRSVVQEEIQNAAIDTTLDQFSNKLSLKYEEWKQKDPLLLSIYREIHSLLKLDQIKGEKYFQNIYLPIAIQTREHDSLTKILLSQFFQLPNFDELLSEGRIVYLQLKEPSYSSKGKKDWLKQLKIVIKGIKIKLDQMALKRVKHNGNYKLLLIIDQIQQLEEYLKDKDKKQEFFSLYHQIKQLNQLELINIIAISYDTVFFSQLTKEMHVQDQPFSIRQMTVKSQVFHKIMKDKFTNENSAFAQLLTANLSQSKEKQGKYLNEILERIGNVSTLSSFLSFHKKIDSSNSFQEFKTNNEQYFKEREEKIRKHLKRIVFKGDKQESEQKIKLLIKILLNFSDRSIWPDQDLAIQNLTQKELAAYKYLCKNKITFYLRFYNPEYRQLFFKIIKQNHYYHPMFKQEYQRIKEKNINSYRYFRQLQQQEEELKNGSWIVPEKEEKRLD